MLDGICVILKGNWLSHLFNKTFRHQLFLTYEEANWRIFQDAYPQLLLYHYSRKYNRPLFYLCKKFYITAFMENEWERFWENRNERRLAYALIINEQHIIEKPVIQKRIICFSFSIIFVTRSACIIVRCYFLLAMGNYMVFLYPIFKMWMHEYI